jgi:hypothetical protein
LEGTDAENTTRRFKGETERVISRAAAAVDAVPVNAVQ